MKALMSILLVAAAPTVALAQAAPSGKPAGSAAAKPAAATAKPAAAGANASGGRSTPSTASGARKSAGALAPSARKAVEEATPIDDDPTIQLTDADRDVAKQVFVGSIPCELGASVTLTPMKREGFFMVTTKGHRFRMHPVESRTGAIRLEDPRRGAMWLQLGNKSMLMSQKLGQRLADECQSPQQVTFADELKRNPRPSILEPAPVQSVPAVPSAPAAPAAAPGTPPAADAVTPAAPATPPAAAPGTPSQ